MAEKRSFSGLKPHIGNNDSVRLEELIEIYKFQDHPDEWCQLRFLERGLLACKRHWVKIFAGKEKKEVTIPRWCISFDPDNESEPLKDVDCPYCELSHGKDGTARAEHFYLVNAIVRDLQEDEPARKVPPTKKEKETGYKDIKSKSWTPVRVIRLTNTLVARFQELAETNIVTSKASGQKKAFDVSHEKYGCDINVKYKPKEPGQSKYSADKAEGGRTPLTQEEMDYLVWDLDPSILDLAGRMTPQQALDDFKKMNIVGGDDLDDDDDDDDSYDLGRSRKKRKDDDDDDDDDSPPPRRKRPAEDEVPAKKRRPAAEEPVKKRRPAAEEAPRRKRPAEDKPVRRASKDEAPARKRRAEPEDEAPAKKRRPAAEAPARSTKKPAAAALSKRTSAAKPGKAKRSVFDDDDDWNTGD